MIYLLFAGGKRNLGLYPRDITAYRSVFEGKPMHDRWVTPSFGISGKSKKLRDFVSWTNAAPLVSEKAKSCLEKLCAPDIEFLPFTTLKNKFYYALNILRVVDVLDISACDAHVSDTTGNIISISQYAFKTLDVEKLPPIFKPAGYLSDILVTAQFAEMIIEYELTGLCLANPCVDNFVKLVKNEPINTYPGIIE